MEPGSSFVPVVRDLYEVSELLGGWRADDPLSYGDTLDAQVYSAAVASGIRVPVTDEVARDRALHDHAITRALSRRLAGRNVVAVMGGHQLARDAEAYRLVAECARTLTREQLVVVTGGGPGAMEAAHLGARLASAAPGELSEALRVLSDVPRFPSYKPNEFVTPDGTLRPDLLRAIHHWQVPAFTVAARWPSTADSIGIPTWLYGHEPPTPLASAHAKYFENSIREDGLLAVATAGVIFAEGSAGTLQEVFQDAAQNYYASVDGTRSPMVFLDLDEFWSVRRPVRLLLEGLFDEETERILHFVSSADDAARAVLAALGR